MMKIPAFILHYFLLAILPVENANPFVRIGLALSTATQDVIRAPTPPAKAKMPTFIDKLISRNRSQKKEKCV